MNYSIFDSDNYYPAQPSESRARTALWVIAGLLAICGIMRLVLALVESQIL